MERLKLKSKSQKKRKSIKIEQIKFVTPQNFSIINNSTEILLFFNKINNEIKKCKLNYLKIFIDMSNINEMTVDALIYLIALIKNIKKEYKGTFSFSGNIPLDEKCSIIVKESGFLDHMQSTNIETLISSKKIQIRSGNNVDTKMSSQICDFIHKITNTTKKDTKILYNIIGEMMNNAVQHAYDETDEYAQKWLLYVENSENKFKFTFLDTGLSIPKTIYKKFFSGDYFKSDYKIVVDAFNGYMTSQTKKSYRGKGLPSIKESVIKGDVAKLNVISSKACCEFHECENKNIAYDLDGPLNGTLYYWEMSFPKEV